MTHHLVSLILQTTEIVSRAFCYLCTITDHPCTIGQICLREHQISIIFDVSNLLRIQSLRSDTVAGMVAK